jgi:hypothetical protein
MKPQKLSKLTQALVQITPIVPLERWENEQIEEIRQKVSLVWYCESILGKELHKQGRVYVGKCPRKYHEKDTPGNEFVIDPSRNTWCCYGAKCQGHNPYGDLLQLHKERFFPFDDIRVAIHDLQKFLPIQEKEKPEANIEFNPSLKKWDETKATKANWGTKDNLSTVQKDKSIKGDERKLADVRRKEHESTKANIIAMSPFKIAEPTPEELAWIIHTSMWKPKDYRCIQKKDNDKYPWIRNEDKLARKLTNNSQTLCDWTYMTCSTYLVADAEGGRRQKSNIVSRYYMCFEIDALQRDDQLKVICHLAEMLPLVCICSSGSTSYHSYFCVNSASIEEMDAFAIEAKTLYADPRTLEPNALCRLPNGIRTMHKGIELPESERRRQQVIYYDPTAITFAEETNTP